jgi:ubiquinone/menaquinone biosynthesis C-methylase UbiE
MFNPNGHIDLADQDFQLPVRDRTFDLIFFWSLFSHLPPHGAEFYLREIDRLLTSAGAAFITGYLWTDDTASQVETGNPRFTFQHDRGFWRAHREDQPEWAVAYRQSWWEQQLADRGLSMSWLHLGNWRNEPTHGQDIMVVRRN